MITKQGHQPTNLQGGWRVHLAYSQLDKVTYMYQYKGHLHWQTVQY